MDSGTTSVLQDPTLFFEPIPLLFSDVNWLCSWHKSRETRRSQEAYTDIGRPYFYLPLEGLLIALPSINGSNKGSVRATMSSLLLGNRVRAFGSYTLSCVEFHEGCNLYRMMNNDVIHYTMSSYFSRTTPCEGLSIVKQQIK